jgi:hypothetical protein
VRALIHGASRRGQQQQTDYKAASRKLERFHISPFSLCAVKKLHACTNLPARMFVWLHKSTQKKI